MLTSCTFLNNRRVGIADQRENQAFKFYSAMPTLHRLAINADLSDARLNKFIKVYGHIVI